MKTYRRHQANAYSDYNSGYILLENDLKAAVKKLRKIGGSVGVITPKDELQRLHVKEGDAVPTIREPAKDLMDEAELSDWIQKSSDHLDPDSTQSP